MDNCLCTLTSFLPCCFFLLLSACPETDTAQLYNTQPDFRARTSGSNRPWVTVFRNKCSHTVILKSGAGPLKPLIHEDPTESRPTTAEPLNTKLLKDLRGLGKPPSFDGNDSDCQDFPFSFRIHMSLVSLASHTLMDKCEIERNPISLVAVKALGDAHLKCCIQMLVRSVEESNGAEAWRLIFSRYALDTQNRQCALMQKVMVPAILWCDHAEGFEFGLRALACREQHMKSLLKPERCLDSLRFPQHQPRI